MEPFFKSERLQAAEQNYRRAVEEYEICRQKLKAAKKFMEELRRDRSEHKPIKAKAARDAAIFDRVNRGEKQKDVAIFYGISPTRVRDVFYREKYRREREKR